MATFPKNKSKKSDFEKTKTLLKKQSATKPKNKIVRLPTGATSRFVNLLALAMQLNQELVKKSIDIELCFDMEDGFCTSSDGVGVKLCYPTVGANGIFDDEDRRVVVNVESEESVYDDVTEDLNKLLKGEANAQDKESRKDAALRKLSQEERELINMGHWRDPITSNRGF
jgi:hypothetical protein